MGSGNGSHTGLAEALEFATNQLAPRAPTDPQFLADFERTMALLIFPADNLAPELAELIDPALRKDVANRVNEAILHSQGARREAKLRNLIRLRAWSEKKARDVGRDIPDRLSIGLEASRNGSHGIEDTVMDGNGASSNGGRRAPVASGEAMVTS